MHIGRVRARPRPLSSKASRTGSISSSASSRMILRISAPTESRGLVAPERGRFAASRGRSTPFASSLLGPYWPARLRCDLKWVERLLEVYGRGAIRSTQNAEVARDHGRVDATGSRLSRDRSPTAAQARPRSPGAQGVLSFSRGRRTSVRGSTGRAAISRQRVVFSNAEMSVNADAPVSRPMDPYAQLEVDLGR